MNVVKNTGWIADLEELTCRNINSNIIVTFEKKRNIYYPKIKNVPVDFFNKWARMNNKEKEMDKIIFEAEDVFMKAFFENDISSENLLTA